MHPLSVYVVRTLIEVELGKNDYVYEWAQNRCIAGTPEFAKEKCELSVYPKGVKTGERWTYWTHETMRGQGQVIGSLVKRLGDFTS